LATPDVQAYKLMKAGRPEAALPFARQAIAGQRVCLPAHGMLATLLLQLGHRRDADAVVSEALGYPSGSADAYDALAHVSMLLGEHERSNALYKRVVTLAPKDPRFWYNLASSERSLGRLPEAETACDRAIALDGSQYPSFLLRSELRVQSRDSNHLTQLRSELSRSGLDDRARTFLGYALAKELDDLHEFDEAFGSLAEAARLRRRHLAYDVAVDQRKLLRIAEVFPAGPTASVGKSATAQESQRYIFIVGLPRSGTTLLEHILLGLPGVRSNGETDNFAQALLAAAPPMGSDVFARAAASDPDAVATRYARLAQGDAGSDKVIDKQPMNYLYLGAIRRALPDSKLVLVSRQPLDSCFAMYRTLFASAYPFSYDFEGLAKYYAAYDRLISHWRATFGDTLHEVSYEELVRDPAQVCAAVAEYCGLQWDPRALEVHKRASVSLTASAAQIRRPIYGSSSGRWLHYRSHLQPLVAALRQLGVPLPPDA
jgi:tetratricopeptide (TPR) repeat protein